VVNQDQTKEQLKKVARKNNRQYWNFWKVILAGWIIRYPHKVFRILGVPLGIMIVMIYNAVTK
jgi:predicted oxidoreductase